MTLKNQIMQAVKECDIDKASRLLWQMRFEMGMTHREVCEKVQDCTGELGLETWRELMYVADNEDADKDFVNRRRWWE